MTDGNASQFVIYQSEDGRIRLDVRFVDETVWLSQALMAELFGTTKQNIGQHLKNIFSEQELDEESVVKDFFTTAAQGEGWRLARHNRIAMWPFPILYTSCRELPSPTRFGNCQGRLDSSMCKKLLAKWRAGNRFATRPVANFTVAAHEAITAYRSATGADQGGSL